MRKFSSASFCFFLCLAAPAYGDAGPGATVAVAGDAGAPAAPAAAIAADAGPKAPAVPGVADPEKNPEGFFVWWYKLAKDRNMLGVLTAFTIFAVFILRSK